MGSSCIGRPVLGGRELLSSGRCLRACCHEPRSAAARLRRDEARGTALSRCPTKLLAPSSRVRAVVVADRATTVASRGEPFVSIVSNDFGRKSSEGVFAQPLYELLCLGGLSFARGGFLSRCDVRQVALQSFFQCHALGSAALDVHATHHFIFGASCQSSASRLVQKVLALVGQPVLRTTAFQVPAGVLTIVVI